MFYHFLFMRLKNKHIVFIFLLIYCISFVFIIPFHTHKDVDYLFENNSFRYNCSVFFGAEHQHDDTNHSDEDNHKHFNCSICYTYNLSNGKLTFIFAFCVFPFIESIRQLKKVFFHLYILSYYHFCRAPPDFI